MLNKYINLTDRKVILILVLISVVISAFSLFQNNEIRRLREIRNSYEVLTQNFVALQQSYDETLDQYQAIKQALDQSTYDLDSLKGQLDSLNQENRSLLDSLQAEITDIIHSIDTTGQELGFFDWRNAENTP